MTLRYTHHLPCPADNIVEYIAAHRDALKILEGQLPIQCEAEGHRYGDPVRVRRTVYDQEYERGQCDFDGSEMSPGKMVSYFDHYEYDWTRKCSRCGKSETRPEAVSVTRSNPFGETP